MGSCIPTFDHLPPVIVLLSLNQRLTLAAKRSALESGDGGACIGNGSHIQIRTFRERRSDTQMRISPAPMLAARISHHPANYRKALAGALDQRLGVRLYVSHRGCRVW